MKSPFSNGFANLRHRLRSEQQQRSQRPAATVWIGHSRSHRILPGLPTNCNSELQLRQSAIPRNMRCRTLTPPPPPFPPPPTPSHSVHRRSALRRNVQTLQATMAQGRDGTRSHCTSARQTLFPRKDSTRSGKQYDKGVGRKSFVRGLLGSLNQSSGRASKRRREIETRRRLGSSDRTMSHSSMSNGDWKSSRSGGKTCRITLMIFPLVMAAQLKTRLPPSTT